MWTELFDRQVALFEGRACVEACRTTRALASEIRSLPCLRTLSDVLHRRIGWRILLVDGLVPNDVMLNMLAHRVFAVSRRLRSVEEMDFTPDPDLFHDVFGHLPLLLNPIYRAYLEGLGRRSLDADPQTLEALSRLMWFSVEVGLVWECGGLRALGGTLLSSRGELTGLRRAESSIERLTVAAVVSTPFQIEDFQSRYFVLDSFDALPDLLVAFDSLHTRQPDLQACA